MPNIHRFEPSNASVMANAGELDADCPIWDHVVQLFVCCDNDPDCQSCEVTPWLHEHHPGTILEWPPALTPKFASSGHLGMYHHNPDWGGKGLRSYEGFMLQCSKGMF